jgi:glucose-1-phosphate thymidylyltransferase
VCQEGFGGGFVKGIILAGGLGTRLFPVTQVISKQLIPVYDKPMIYYSLSMLIMANIKEILIISTPRDLVLFQELLGDGSRLGISLSYAEQREPAGLPQAFLIGENFIGKNDVCLILGDNIFHGQSFMHYLEDCCKDLEGGLVFGYSVNDPERYGIVNFDTQGHIISIEEKPSDPKSNIAITGLYFFDCNVVQFAKELKPSLRGELEITDILKKYLSLQKLKVEILGRGVAWLDTGTPRSLLEASLYVSVLEERQGLKICCPEEIAWRKGFISAEQLEKLALTLSKNSYGKYLLKVLNNNA